MSDALQKLPRRAPSLRRPAMLQRGTATAPITWAASRRRRWLDVRPLLHSTHIATHVARRCRLWPSGNSRQSDVILFLIPRLTVRLADPYGPGIPHGAPGLDRTV